MYKKMNILKVSIFKIFFLININGAYSNVPLEKFSYSSKDSFLKVKNNFSSMVSLPNRKTIKILSIDGGGVRGIIPAFILKNIETRLKKKKLVECFDIMSGTSTGGIIILLLNIPDNKGNPKYTAKNVYQFYKDLSASAFNQTTWQYIKTLNGWIEEKYSTDNLEHLLEIYFQNIPLDKSITDIIIPSYNIAANKAVFFNNRKALENDIHNFYMKDVARATSAAPTYFKPAKIKDMTGQQYIFIDGGVAANNPTLEAIIYAYRIYGYDNNFLIISLGTGNSYGVDEDSFYIESKVIKGGILHWASDISSLLMYSASDVIDYQLTNIMDRNASSLYYRFQVTLEPKHSQMDNASVENLEILEDCAQSLLYDQDKKLDEIAYILENY